MYKRQVHTVCSELALDVPARAAGAVAQRAAALDHKAGNHAVEGQAVVKALADQLLEILTGDRLSLIHILPVMLASAVVGGILAGPALAGMYDLPSSQNLLVLPGTQLSQLRTVYSHQQAIAQSETFLKPVSYTHLDVYKRQVLLASVSACAARAAGSSSAKGVSARPAHRAMWAVSYTHLDVYKRQVLGRPSTYT